MDRQFRNAILDRLMELSRVGDKATSLRIVSEVIDTTEGAEKAYWLRYRATLQHSVLRTPPTDPFYRTDLEEACRLDPTDVEGVILPILSAVASEQDFSHLKLIPATLRPDIRRKLSPSWRCWYLMALIHWWRRRWYQSYQACHKAVSLLSAASPEVRKYYLGWLAMYHLGRGRAALRLGRPDEAAADIEQTFRIMENRPLVTPLWPYIGRAELALHGGDCEAALAAMHKGIALTAHRPASEFLKQDRVELAILAARIAGAQGNQLGFEHFCQHGLTLALENKLPWSEAGFRALLAGAPF